MVAQSVFVSSPKRLLLAAVVLLVLPMFGLLTAFGLAPDTSLDSRSSKVIESEVQLPSLLGSQSGAVFYQQDRVQRGDTVAGLLARLQVRDREAFDYLRRDPLASTLFRQLRPGKPIHAEVGPAGELVSLRYYLSPEKRLDVSRTGTGFEAAERDYRAPPQVVHKTGQIKSSLFAATDQAGIPDAVAIQIARIFSTDIDFHVDLRKGDHFAVAYEMHLEDGELIRPGRVLFAEFVNAGRVFDAFLFSAPDGEEGYYTGQGENRAKSFLRSPLEFSRVSSGFGARFHPIFKNWRAHTGVDFAAPKGTRIWATADAVVEFAGVKGGYGNCVELRHSGGVTTLYAHLSGFAAGVRRGQRVKQGEIIGYVGATGWATGPHLHYEFKVSGIHQDPMRVALPKAAPLPETQKPAFAAVVAAAKPNLELLRVARFGRFE